MPSGTYEDHLRRRDRGVADAVVEVLTRTDAPTLAALGTVVAFLKEEAVAAGPVHRDQSSQPPRRPADNLRHV